MGESADTVCKRTCQLSLEHRILAKASISSCIHPAFPKSCILSIIDVSYQSCSAVSCCNVEFISSCPGSLLSPQDRLRPASYVQDLSPHVCSLVRSGGLRSSSFAVMALFEDQELSAACACLLVACKRRLSEGTWIAEDRQKRWCTQ
jgi:hypothetical protein